MLVLALLMVGAAPADLAARLRPHDCDATTPAQETPLPDGSTLVEVSCTFAAYQGASLFYVRTADRALRGPLVFEQVDGEGALGARVRVLGIAHVEGARLTVEQKARGIGDCGSFSAYDLSKAKAGAVVKLAELRVKSACDEKIVPVEQWAHQRLAPLRARAAPSTLGKDDVRSVVNKSMDAVRTCYEARDDKGELCPPVDVAFIVGTDGAPGEVRATARPRELVLEQCLTEVARAWAFPASPATTSVTYPLHFRCVRD